MPGTRFIEIARHSARLSLRSGCIVVSREGMPEATVAVFELAAVVLAHPQASISQPAMAALMAEGVPLLVCDGSLLPSGLMLPMSGNVLSARRMLAQAAATLPMKKRLWAQIVRAKVLAQATTLEGLWNDDAGLRALAREVRSGDPTNIEAQAAQRYWPMIFRDTEFRRRFEAQDQNRLLNYGYAVLRAAVARAICAAGLHPTLGVFHKGRENPFCLADDLMEPYRPLVDSEVAKLCGEFGRDCPLESPAKARLIELLDLRVQVRDNESAMRSVSECMFMTATSVCAAFEGAEKNTETVEAGERNATQARVFYPVGLLRW